MKKLIALVMLIACIFCASAFCETATPTEPLPEGSFYVHGYRNALTGYYVAVPAEWALIGLDSIPGNLEQAYEIMGFSDVSALMNQLSEENDILFSVASTGEQMVLTYGLSDGITCDKLVEEIDDFKSMLKASYTGIEFKEDSGSVTIGELTQVMYIGAKYKGHDISQYFLPAGDHVFVFTFTDVETEMEHNVISTFSIVKE